MKRRDFLKLIGVGLAAPAALVATTQGARKPEGLVFANGVDKVKPWPSPYKGDGVVVIDFGDSPEERRLTQQLIDQWEEEWIAANGRYRGIRET